MLEGSLNNVIEDEGLRWIFVGGKGGVGKTTTSCSLAVQMSKVRPSVLLISTDPAHNISDAFRQKLGSVPTLVKGFDNLYAMEIDPAAQIDKLLKGDGGSDISATKKLAAMFPGVDEAMNISEVIELVENKNYSCVIFDTAPTGHTLRLISFPSALGKILDKINSLGGGFKNIFSQVNSLMSPNNQNGDEVNKLFDKLNSTKKKLDKIQSEFTDPNKTTFICVCISEFLSLYETERLVQELGDYGIETHNIVVNQLISPEESSSCKNCKVRSSMQEKYIKQIYELYEDFNVTEIPLFTEEIRGVDKISSFSELLKTERRHFS